MDRSTKFSGAKQFAPDEIGRPGTVLSFGHGKAVVGIAEVAKEGYPDPTADDPQWVAVALKPVKPLAEPVPLAAIRYHEKLGSLPLIRQSQLSVMPLTKEEFEVIVAMGDGKKSKKSRKK